MSKKRQNKQIGNLGEQIVCDYLVSKGFTVLERNYDVGYAEIDIIAAKDKMTHFIEVKTVSHETKSDLQFAVTHGTWRPEEQVHLQKQHKISLGVETWLQRNNYLGEWQIDVAAVRVVPRETFATVKMIEDVILG